jgi:hypothetical protein
MANPKSRAEFESTMKHVPALIEQARREFEEYNRQNGIKDAPILTPPTEASVQPAPAACESFPA